MMMNDNMIEVSQTNTETVRYYVQVDGQGAPLILLHGFTGSGAVWDEVVPTLVQRFSVIRPDLLGHGKTDAPDNSARYDIDTQARDIITLANALGYKHFALHGYSMGGRLALYLAERYPSHVSALSLESASPGLAAEEERQARIAHDEALAEAIERDGVAPFVDSWEKLALFAGLQQLPDVQRLKLRNIRLNQRAKGLANSLRGMGTGRQPSLWDELGHYGGKRLIVTGEKDAKFCTIADDMATRVSGTLRVTVPQAGHTIHLEQSEQWIDIVMRFLDEALA